MFLSLSVAAKIVRQTVPIVNVAKGVRMCDLCHSVLFDAGVRVPRVAPCFSDQLFAGVYPGRH